MFPIQLSQPQREAMLDLLLLGMYADGAVKLAENERIYDVLSPLGWEGYQDAREYSQTATSRVRGAAESAENTAQFLAGISSRLGGDDAKKLALAMLVRVIESDDNATESEAELYQAAKTTFGV